MKPNIPIVRVYSAVAIQVNARKQDTADQL